MSHLSRKQLMLLGSAIFGLFFGAGNLIFPAHLGQLAGSHWGMAAIGFLITGTLLPLLALVSLAVTRSNSMHDLALPVAPWFATIFTVLIHLTLGPFFATPRTASISYELTIGSWFPHIGGTGLVIYSIIFFGLALLVALRGESGIMKWVGKILNPIFIMLLALLFILAIIHPFGSFTNAASDPTYNTNAIAQGFLQGYNTMDVMAALAFGVSVTRLISSFGIKDTKSISMWTLKGSGIAMIGMAVIYAGLIALGSMSLTHGKFSATDSGTLALQEIVQSIFGNAGMYILGILAILALFTTAIGLISAFARDFSDMFPKISYRWWVAITTLMSLGTANLGLATIIAWATPFLYLLYPLALAIVLSALTKSLHGNSAWVYRLSALGAFIFAIFDALMTSPFAGSMTHLITWYTSTIPLASLNLAWILPTIIGWLLGMGITYAQRSKERAGEPTTY